MNQRLGEGQKRGTKVGYVRVSRSQHQSGEGQLKALQARGLDEIYTEAISRASRKKPVRDKLLRELGEGDEIHFFALDRIAGSTADLVRVLERARRTKVRLVSVTQELDTESPAGRALMNLLGVFAQFEREVLIERTKAGIRAAKLSGKKLGRPRKINRQQVAETRHLTAGKAAMILGVSKKTIRRRRRDD